MSILQSINVHRFRKFDIFTLWEDMMISYQGNVLLFRPWIDMISMSSVSPCTCSINGRRYNNKDTMILSMPSQFLSIKALTTMCICCRGTILPNIGSIHPMTKMPRLTSYFSIYIIILCTRCLCKS